MSISHVPVLKNEVMRSLRPRTRNELLIDATLGEAGHAEMFLSHYSTLRLVGIDADPTILEIARRRLTPFADRVQFFNTWFNVFFKEYPAELARPNIVLFDLGISTYHFVVSGRGFSFQKDEPLDMRLSDELETSAYEIVNDYPEAALAKILFEFGEERLSRQIARAIVAKRQRSPLSTTRELADVVAGAVPPQYRHARINPATRTFQAIRIAVNGELPRLESALAAALRVLVVGGRIGVITFHSLEDRIVKQFFREKNKNCTCPPEQPICTCGGKRIVDIVTRKPIVASDRERELNPPSRSAKLRVAIKVAEEL